MYRDVRRFGTWLLLEPDELDPYLAARLGREPLERSFTTRRLAEALAGRRTPVKAAILDQRRLAGSGTSMRTRHSGARDPPAAPGGRAAPMSAGPSRAGFARARGRDRPAGRHASRLPHSRTAGRAGCSTSSRSTAARGSPVTAAARRSRRSAPPAAERGTARVPADVAQAASLSSSPLRSSCHNSV